MSNLKSFLEIEGDNASLGYVRHSVGQESRRVLVTCKSSGLGQQATYPPPSASANNASLSNLSANSAAGYDQTLLISINAGSVTTGKNGHDWRVNGSNVITAAFRKP